MSVGEGESGWRKEEEEYNSLHSQDGNIQKLHDTEATTN